MSDTVKVVIEIPKEAKQAFDIAQSNDLKGGYYDHGGIIGKAIQNGIPLDDVKAEIEQLRLHKAKFLTNDNKVCIDSQTVLDILDNIGKESEVKPNDGKGT